MRLLTFLFFFIFSIGFSQDLKKLIDKDDPEKLEQYLAGGGTISSDLVYYHKEDDTTYRKNPLIYAVGKEKKESLKFFIRHKDKIEDYETVISEAFILSLSRKDEELAEIIYAENPDLNGTCSDCRGATAIMIAAANGREDWYFKLKPKSNLLFITDLNRNLLHFGAGSSSQKIFEDIITIQNLDINLKDNMDMYPITFAATNIKNPKAFMSLINAGADPGLEKDIFSSVFYGCNLTALNYLYDHHLDENLWTRNKANVFPLEEAFFYREDDEGNTFYLPNQPLFCASVINRYIESVKSDCKLVNPEIFDDINYIYVICLMAQQYDVLFLYEKFISFLNYTELRCRGIYPNIGKFNYKQVVKAFGKENVDEIHDRYEVYHDKYLYTDGTSFLDEETEE